MRECQYLGPEVDPIRDHPVVFCGAPTISGKSYCLEHYHVVYKVGTQLTGKRKARAVENEMKQLELQELIAAQEADEEIVNV